MAHKKWIAALLALHCFLPVSIKAYDDLILGGDSVGIQVQYEGVMVTGTYGIKVNDTLYDPKEHGIQSGDRIVAVNNHPISDMKDLYVQIAQFQEEQNQVPITLIRGNDSISENLLTLYSKKDQTFQSGLYIKDGITGVGTMTFYDPDTQRFGALGHEILDSDTKDIAAIDKGNIYPAAVTSISAAQKNIAGEKHAKISFDQPLGTIDENTQIGIYGSFDQLPQEQVRLPWAAQKEIHLGEAQIYTVLDGTTIQSYSISITKLHPQTQADVKGIEFMITDETLLSKTNGVIQGMSGSPIVQDGKIIGAITHVITSQPCSGYGVYIEWMLQEANQ